MSVVEMTIHLVLSSRKFVGRSESGSSGWRGRIDAAHKIHGSFAALRMTSWSYGPNFRDPTPVS